MMQVAWNMCAQRCSLATSSSLCGAQRQAGSQAGRQTGREGGDGDLFLELDCRMTHLRNLKILT